MRHEKDDVAARPSAPLPAKKIVAPTWALTLAPRRAVS
jgi:hypothetical protein